MIKYNVRSRQIIDLMNEIKTRKLIMAPYFQRKLVWRDVHKVDFIKTIILGFPFPEIFIANGDLDIDAMESTSCIVDGQQRLTSIRQFINNEFEVDGKLYCDLSAEEKEDFLKYEVPVIDLDVKHDDPIIQDIFQRLNRTFYSLSNIEKLSSEYGACEFMLIAKLLAKEFPLRFYNQEDEDENELSIEFDPNINPQFIVWAKNKKVSKFNKLITESPMFSGYELSRQVHLNFVLNIIGVITQGIYNRNLKKDILEEYSENFPEKDTIIDGLEKVAGIINSMKLKKSSYWYNKANMFSLIVAIYNNIEKVTEIGPTMLKSRLENFENDIPEEYQLAAREGVNNKRERIIRNKYIFDLIYV